MSLLLSNEKCRISRAKFKKKKQTKRKTTKMKVRNAHVGKR